MIGFYLLPASPLTEMISPITKAYVKPIFRQNWHMFAPTPLTFSSRLIVKCGKSSDWIDPTQDLLKSHSTFPMIHLQKTIFLYNTIAQTILDSRSQYKAESRCSFSQCENGFKAWIKKSDAFRKAASFGHEVCANDLTKIAVYIEHAKAFNDHYQIPNRGTEILELN